MSRSTEYKLFGKIPFTLVFYGVFVVLILIILGFSHLYNSQRVNKNEPPKSTQSNQSSGCNYEGCEEHRIEDAQYEEWKLEQQGAYDN